LQDLETGESWPKPPIQHGDNCRGLLTACKQCVEDYDEWRKEREKELVYERFTGEHLFSGAKKNG
jgi:hypothetical protein